MRHAAQDRFVHFNGCNDRSSGSCEMHIESLESRCMLAGNVTAIVTGGGDVRIFGDARDNDVVVHSTGNEGELFVEGLSGTTINGQDSVTLTGVDDDMRVVLRGGNDRLLITAAFDDGSTADTIRFLDDITINAGSGNDAIVLDGITQAGNVGVVTASGDDSVSMVLVVADNVAVITGSGDDVVGFSLINGVTENTLIVTGAGDDIVGVTGASSGFLSTQFQGSFTMLLGAGDDAVAIDGGRFQGGRVILGGAGRDSLQVSAGVTDITPLNLGIEEFGDDSQPIFESAFEQGVAVAGFGVWISEGLGQFLV